MALHQQPPFFNPSVPFSTPIQGGLQDGMSITVNLQYGSDVILHFNPRYEGGSGFVVHYTNQKGVWGEEEHEYKTPKYNYLFDGKPFFEYKHRMPFSCVDHIYVFGKVELNLVAFQYLPHYAAPPGSFTMPYKSIIYGGVQPGKVIIIQGVISPQAKRICFKLRYITGIALEYSLRFDENVVVCNTYDDGTWGKEEQCGCMPFKRGQPLQVTIFCTHQNFEVFSNGEKVHTYSHRYSNLENIDVLDIRGDVQLSFVQP
uniref:Galectin n=1 Tax=Sinocyclocheilus anshuiensis TaxID=1608454 RepID=A0A671M9G4_9TELE